jgi:hypothetical protein
MPRLIEIDKSCEKQVTHKKCGAVIGYFQNEVQNKKVTDYGGGNDTYYYIICPNCGENIEVKGH